MEGLTTTTPEAPEEYIEPSPPEPIGNLPPAWKRTTVSLELPKGITIHQWLKGVRTLEKTGKGHQWHIGDALLQGEELWPEEWAQAVDPDEEEKREQETGDSHRKYMQVSRQMPIGTRVPDLTWTHHRVVAFLESPEERTFWLQKALREGLSSRAMERAIRKAQKGEQAGGPGDLEVLQDPAVRQWLDDYRVLINEHEKALPPQASYLKNMLYAHRDHAQRQLERTMAVDCRIVKKAVALMRGTDDEIFTCLQTRGYFMSDPDLDDRLALLIGMGQIYKKEAEGRKKGQRGKMVQVYLPFRTEDDDIEDDPGFD
jgi:hypothetical protein